MIRSHSLPTLRNSPHAPLACTLGALLLCGPAQAQLLESLDRPLRPYYLQVSETLTYESNLFRESRDEDSDIISSTTLTGGFDQRIGRQRVFGNAGVSGNIYKDNDQLNGIGYTMLLGLAWEAGSSLSGSARVRAAQNQASFADYGSFAGNRNGKNRERSNSIDLNAQYGRGVVRLEALANHTDVRYSSSGFQNRDRTSDMVGAGLRWAPGGPWSFGLRARYTEGEYPDTVDLLTGARQSDDYERRDIDLTAQYRATGRSSFSGRISHTREEHDLVAARDFSGLTGALNWIYELTGKTTMNTSLTRNTGTGTGSTFTPALSEDPLAPSETGTVNFLTDSRRSDTLSLSFDWQATAKIGVNAGASYSRDRFDTRFVDDTGEDGNRTGTTKRLNLSANYAITRAWSLGCGVSHQKKETDISTSEGSFGYDANIVYCTAALRLQ